MKIITCVIMSTMAFAMCFATTTGNTFDCDNISPNKDPHMSEKAECTESTESGLVDTTQNVFKFGGPKRNYNGLSPDDYIQVLSEFKEGFKALQESETMDLDKYTEIKDAFSEVQKAMWKASFASGERNRVIPVLNSATLQSLHLDVWIMNVCSHDMDTFGYCIIFSPDRYLKKSRSLKDIFSNLLKISSDLKNIDAELRDNCNSAIDEIFHLTKSQLDEVLKTPTKYWLGGDRNAAVAEGKNAFKESEKVKVSLGM